MRVRTLCKRAYDEMIELVGKRVQEIKDLKSFSNESEIESTFFDLCCEEFSASIDGFLGMQAQLPLCPKLTKLVSLINQTDRIGVRVAVDIPTGVGEGLVNEALKADFTYATGIAKSPIINVENLQWVGRLRYLDLGFFKDENDGISNDSKVGVLRPSVLRVLRKLRPVHSDKRSNGHLFLLLLVLEN